VSEDDELFDKIGTDTEAEQMRKRKEARFRNPPEGASLCPRTYGVWCSAWDDLPNNTMQVACEQWRWELNPGPGYEKCNTCGWWVKSS
jgi:hypothetical protein